MDTIEARRKMRSAIGDATRPFNMYGLGDYIPPACTNIMAAAEQFHKDMCEAKAIYESEK